MVKIPVNLKFPVNLKLGDLVGVTERVVFMRMIELLKDKENSLLMI